MKLTDKMAYLRGMIDGMELDLKTSKEGKVLAQLLDVMQDVTNYVEDLQAQVDELTEVCDLLDRDLEDVEEFIYADDTAEENTVYSMHDDMPELEEEVYETTCPSCGMTLELTEANLEEGEMVCPICGEMLEFDFSEMDVPEDTEDASETD